MKKLFKSQILLILFLITKNLKYCFQYFSISKNKKYQNILKKNLVETKKYPSLFIDHIYPKFDTVELYAIYGILKKIEKKKIPKKLNLEGKKFSFFAQSLEQLAFNLSLSLIYSTLGAQCKNFFYYDEFDLSRNLKKTLDVDDYKILDLEFNMINKNFKNIDILRLNDSKKSNISKNLKEQIKVNSVKDITAYSQIFSLKEKDNYKSIHNKIFNKKNLKERYLTNLDFAKKITKYVSKKDYWIIHNSNLSKNGVLQMLINSKGSNFTSHESTNYKEIIKNSNKPNAFKFLYLKNKEVLSFDFSDEIKTFLHQNDYEKEKKGAEIIKNNFKKNFSLKEEKIILKNFDFLNNNNKDKVFVLLANIFFESRYLLPKTHSIFNNYKEFLIKTISYFNQSDCKLIIKIHPGELNLTEKYNDSHEKMLKNLNLKNIFLIPDYKISSYSLKNISNNFIVYDTDMGVEMSYENKNVITCSNSKYKAFNLTFFPKNQQDYFDTINRLSKNDIIDRTKYFNISKKRCAKYWYFFINEMFKDLLFSYGNSLNDLNQNFKTIFNNVETNEYFRNIINIVNEDKLS